MKNLLQRYVEQVEQDLEKRRQDALPIREKIRNLRLSLQKTAKLPPIKKAPAALPKPAIKPQPVKILNQAPPVKKSNCKPPPGGWITPEEARRQITELLNGYDSNQKHKL